MTVTKRNTAKTEYYLTIEDIKAILSELKSESDKALFAWMLN